MSRNDEYRPGNPEYDYWNDKNLYPSLRNDGDDFSGKARTVSEDGKIGFGSAFAAVIVWIVLIAPFCLFLTWENWLLRVLFWGGAAIVVLILVMAFYNAVQDEKQKHASKRPEVDHNVPLYKQYPPADVIKNRKQDKKN